MFGHHGYQVGEARFEVPAEGGGLVTLDLAVLDGRALQEVVHLDSKNGSGSSFILRALGTCRTSVTLMETLPGRRYHGNTAQAALRLPEVPPSDIPPIRCF